MIRTSNRRNAGSRLNKKHKFVPTRNKELVEMSSVNPANQWMVDGVFSRLLHAQKLAHQQSLREAAENEAALNS